MNIGAQGGIRWRMLDIFRKFLKQDVENVDYEHI